MNRFGEKLATLRQQHGLTIRQLGVELGVNHTFISQLEKNRRKPNAEMILKISLFFEMSTDQLMRDDLELE